MVSKNALKKSFFHSHWLLIIAPLLAYPFMVNLRVFPFIAPNEEPKWAVLTVCFLWLGLAAAWLWLKRPSALQLPKLRIPSFLLFTYLLILAIGVFIGPNQTEGLVRFSFWFFCIAIMITSIWAIQHEPRWMEGLTWSLSIGTFIFSLQYWWSYVLDYGKPNYNIHVLFSPIGHVNFTGDVLIILLPVLIWLLATQKNPIMTVLNWFSLTTVATVLLVASSRGALGGVVLGSIMLLIISIKHYQQWVSILNTKAYYLPTALVLSALISSSIIYTNLPYHYRDLARISSTAGQTATGKGKIELTPNVLQPPFVNMWVELSPLLGARTSIFAATTAMTLEKPLLGQGTGNFPWVYPNFSNRYPDFKDPLSSARTFTTNPHNVVLQIASQNGILAMIIFIGLLLYFWFLLLRATWRKWNGWQVSGVAAISAVIFDAMFNHVFYNPASMFVFALLAGAWWGSLHTTHSEDLKSQLTCNSRFASFISIALVLILCTWPIRWLSSEWYVGQAMAHANQTQTEAYYYQKAYEWDKENFRAVFGMGQVAYRQRQYSQSVFYFESFEKFYPYNPPALNMLAASYMSSGQLFQAKAVLERALKIYPNFDMAEQNLQRIEMILQRQKQLNLQNQ